MFAQEAGAGGVIQFGVGEAQVGFADFAAVRHEAVEQASQCAADGHAQRLWQLYEQPEQGADEPVAEVAGGEELSRQGVSLYDVCFWEFFMKLVLASSSPFRAAILRNLALPFSAVSPDVDESRLPGESPQALVERLAVAKARAVAADAETFVIGSDQVATLDGEVLGKPHTVNNAVAQLSRF